MIWLIGLCRLMMIVFFEKILICFLGVVIRGKIMFEFWKNCLCGFCLGLFLLSCFGGVV